MADDGGDRSPKTKAVTGYRTPNQEAEEIIKRLKEIRKGRISNSISSNPNSEFPKSEIQIDPLIDTLRDDPRFKVMVRQRGLSE